MHTLATRLDKRLVPFEEIAGLFEIRWCGFLQMFPLGLDFEQPFAPKGVSALSG